MAQPIFHFLGQLPESLVVAFWKEQWIIAESPGSPEFKANAALANSFKQLGLQFEFVRKTHRRIRAAVCLRNRCQRKNTFEPRTPPFVGNVSQQAQEFGVVFSGWRIPRIPGIESREASRVHTRSASERIHLETRIISKDEERLGLHCRLRLSRMRCQPLGQFYGLLGGVSRKCARVLDHLRSLRELSQRLAQETLAQDGADFSDLMRIARRDYQRSHDT